MKSTYKNSLTIQQVFKKIIIKTFGMYFVEDQQTIQKC